MNPIRCAARGSAAVIGLSDRADGLGEDGVVMRQMAHQHFGVKIYRTDGVCTFPHPQRWWEKCESPHLGSSPPTCEINGFVG